VNLLTHYYSTTYRSPEIFKLRKKPGLALSPLGKKLLGFFSFLYGLAAFHSYYLLIQCCLGMLTENKILRHPTTQPSAHNTLLADIVKYILVSWVRPGQG